MEFVRWIGEDVSDVVFEGRRDCKISLQEGKSCSVSGRYVGGAVSCPDGGLVRRQKASRGSSDSRAHDVPVQNLPVEGI